mmetsp:Transcript_29092/g.48089  ORF Transcript_29092/g.48089 Transcript_29092/m.48089 type:complete len:800 (-) Transcript_29092:228-2627(-)
MSPTSTISEPPSRAALRSARRVCVKAGTSVVANEDGRPSLTRLGAIAEQIAELSRSGVQVIFVSSGAVGMGKRVLRKQSKLSMTVQEWHNEQDNNSQQKVKGGTSAGVSTSTSFASLLNLNARPHTFEEKAKCYDSACAAAGQFEMMNFYSSLFDQADVSASQILVTQSDFTNDHRKQNLMYTVDRLLTLGVIPIINENDAVSANEGYTSANIFSDNDSLAALCARSFSAEVLVLLTDVPGVYDSSPKENPNARLLPLYRNDIPIAIGTKSSQGRGGMSSKIDAATFAVSAAGDGDDSSVCSACVVAAGSDLDSIRAILGPDPKYGSKGTLFVTPGSDLETQALIDFKSESPSSTGISANQTNVSKEARQKAVEARTEARKLQVLPHAVRKNMLYAIANALLEREDEIMAANAMDVDQAEADGTALVLRKRLKLTDQKLATLSSGLRQIADQPDPLGVLKAKREVSHNLELSLLTVPIGVLMIIFESRPDSMPQIAALALASGNGLLLKGGKEAVNSNAKLHEIIGDAVEEGSNGNIKRSIIALVTSRGQVADMLSLDDVIDLVIPRGSNALVSYIKGNTRIPVLGHADGVCHVYIDSSCEDATAASNLVVDAKIDYPSACNAMETLLLHKDTVTGVASSVLMALRAAGVKCLGGPAAMKMGLADVAAAELKCEYGDLTCMVEVVDSMDDAIDWIHQYGSGHTESIVCADDSPNGEEFLRRVDAACVFKNASTRFADGFRFGLGAEVGISTGRIHSRGPVGVEGLLTTKWQLRSNGGVSYVGEYAGEAPKKKYTHKELM